MGWGSKRKKASPAKPGTPPSKPNVAPKVPASSPKPTPASHTSPSSESDLGKLEAKVTRLELLMDISRQFSSTLDFDKLMNTIFEKVLMVLEAEAGSFWVPDGNEVVCNIAAGPAKKQVTGLRLPEGTGVVGWVMQNRQKTVIFDASKDERFSKKVDQKTNFVTKSMLCVPLVVKDECVGAIQVINKKSHNGQFTDIDLDALVNLANSGAIAVKNARLYQSEQRIKELNTLLNISQELTSTLDLDRVLLSVVNLGSQVIHYKRAVIGLVGKQGEVVLAAESKQAVPDAQSPENKTLQSIFNYVMSSSSSLYINRFNAEKPPEGVPEVAINYMKSQEIHCLSVIILSDSEGALGLLSMEGVYSSLVGNNSQYVINMLVNQATVGIRNAQLYQNIPSTGMAERFKSGTLVSKNRLSQLARIGILAVFVLIAVLFLPIPSDITTNIEIVPEHRSQVTIQHGGVVKTVWFKEGDLVKKGQLLLEIDPSELLLERAKIQKDKQIADSDLRLQESMGNAAATHLARLALEKLDNQLMAIEYKLESALVVAPSSGRVLLPDPDDLLDKQLTEGEVITELAIGDRKSVHLLIEEDDVLHVRPGHEASLILQMHPGETIEGKIQAISQIKFEEEEAEEEYYIGYMKSEELNHLPAVKFGMTGVAKVHSGEQSIYKLYIEKAVWPYLTQLRLLFRYDAD